MQGFVDTLPHPVRKSNLPVSVITCDVHCSMRAWGNDGDAVVIAGLGIAIQFTRESRSLPYVTPPAGGVPGLIRHR